MVASVRRHVSILALCLAWLCANGAIWNVVQVVAWARMFHEFSQVMPAAQALEVTFNGSAPCDLCKITEQARENERQQLPQEAALGASDKLVLACQTPVPVIFSQNDVTWPGIVDATGLLRTEAVPVPPPRV